MKLIKPFLWTVLGVVIGASAVLSASRVQAQQKPAERIQVQPTWVNERSDSWNMYVVKDNKSGGCWVATKDSRGSWSGLAVAPPTACD